jgi:hypothetical protein
MVGAEQFPIPCQRCGASMVVEPPSSVLASPMARCGYCGAVESVPAEAAERVRTLRLRLAQIRFAEQAEEAPAIAMARTLSMWKQVSLPMIGVMGLLLVVVSGANVANVALSGSATAAMLVQMALMPVGGLLLLSVVTGGFLWSMRAFAAELRPALDARPPLAEGAPLRCRGCGSALPTQGNEGIVPCAFCGASNVVSADIARERHARLEVETQHYAQRLAGHRVRLDEATRRYTRRVYLASGVAAALCITATLGLSVLGALLPRLLPQ